MDSYSIRDQGNDSSVRLHESQDIRSSEVYPMYMNPTYGKIPETPSLSTFL